MKLSIVSTAVTAAGLASAAPAGLKARSGGPQGFDISSYQGTVDFQAAYNDGARFVIIKATEALDYIDSTFSDHYEGATNAGLIRGAYHFAHPDESSGADQANFFLEHGGGWSGDGITLPGMLDIEYNPSGDTCYGLDADSIVTFIQDFVDTYQSKTTRYPLIYTTYDWWTTCTGDSTAFSANSPLVLARYSDDVGSIPGGWPWETIWQNSDSYTYGGDSDVFNGDEAGLQKLASG